MGTGINMSMTPTAIRLTTRTAMAQKEAPRSPLRPAKVKLSR
jgi:hypothetical protein